MATYDILIFQGVTPRGEDQVSLLLGNPGFFTTGIQKVSQSFIKLFLTDIGSVANDPAAGTSFMAALRKNQIRDETTLQSYFQAAVVDVINYMSEEESGAVPDDETLANATLVEWDLRPGFLSIKVEITTEAGESRIYVVPVETRVSA